MQQIDRSPMIKQDTERVVMNKICITSTNEYLSMMKSATHLVDHSSITNLLHTMVKDKNWSYSPLCPDNESDT